MTQAIFLSYASQDADAVRRICDALRAEGLEVWFDQNELTGGDAWDQKIRRQVKECSLFVPLISANTQARPEGYFRLEWRLADQRTHLMAKGIPFILPVSIDGTSEATALVPDSFMDVQWTKLSDETSTTAFAARVAKLASGGGASSTNDSKRPSNNGVASLATAPKTVAPDAAKRKSGAQFSSTAQGQPNLDPDLRRDDNVKSGAKGEPTASTTSALSTATPATTVRKIAIGLISVALLAVLSIGGMKWLEKNRDAAFVASAIPTIEKLARESKHVEAFKLAREVELRGGGSLLTPAIWDDFTRSISITTTPAGAALSFRRFGAEGDAMALGNVALDKVRVPRGPLMWRAEAPGYAVAEQVFSATPNAKLAIELIKPNAANGDMVRVSGGDVRLWGLGGVEAAKSVVLPPFLLDRAEVTNQQYAAFVRAGGYEKPEFWQAPFKDGNRTLTFKDAMDRFRDSTGRPGPATWRVGQFPDGEDALPVRGISWYEAMAFAAFSGKSLPTLYHWFWADTAGDVGFLPGLFLAASNYESKGPRAASASKSKSAFGAIDMAGNVREWIANPTKDGMQVTLGGGWTDPAYQYLFGDARSAFDRAPENGTRLMKALDAAPLPATATAALERIVAPTKPARVATESEYQTFARFFEGKAVPLDAKIELNDDSSPKWTKQKISFAAGYGGERLTAYLYLPKTAKPPYQVVIQMAGAGTFLRRSSATEQDFFGWGFAEPMLRGGRAVLLPLWKGSYERATGFLPLESSIPEYRDHVSKWILELHQSIDYLESRDDINRAGITYQGISFGAIWASQFMALEPRIKTGLLLVGGIYSGPGNATQFPPEMSAYSYAPRVKAPVLMLNGRYDPLFPYETSQVPLFNLFGTPKEQKRHQTFPGGHSSFGWNDELVRESLDWLDKYIGQPNLTTATAK